MLSYGYIPTLEGEERKADENRTRATEMRRGPNDGTRWNFRAARAHPRRSRPRETGSFSEESCVAASATTMPR